MLPIVLWCFHKPSDLTIVESLQDRDGKLLPLPGKESTESFIEVGPEGVSIIGSPRQAAAPDRLLPPLHYLIT